jgi:hypothetical protein
MKKLARTLSNVGCLVSVLAPIVALVLYPNANWLFGFALIGVAILVVSFMTSKELSPQEVGEFAQRLLDGRVAGLDVDDYERLNLKDPILRELWQSTMSIGGLPEEWVELNQDRKNELREIIPKMKEKQL